VRTASGASEQRMEKKGHVKPLKRFHTSKLSPIRHAGFALLILRILESSLVDSRRCSREA